MGKAGIEKTSKKSPAIRTAAQTAVLMAILTLVSKLFGFVREMVFAAYFGAGYVMDAYSMAQSIPNMLFSGILQATAVSFMPLFSEKNEKDTKEAGNNFVSDVLNLLVKISVLLGIFGIVFSEQLVGIFAHGFNEEQAELTAFFLKVSFIYLIFNSCNGVLRNYLEYKGVFLRPILFGYVQNLIIILCAVFAAYSNERYLIFGMFFSYLMCMIFFVHLAGKEGFKWKFSLKHSGTVATQILALALPAFVGGYVATINTYVDKSLASGLPEGSVAALGYAVTIVGLVNGLTVAIISTIIFPRLNQARAQGDLLYYNELLSGGFNLYAIISVPCGMGAMIFANEIVQVIYERGVFDAAATSMTAVALFWYGPHLCLSQLNNQSIFAFQTNKDMKTPMYVGFVSVAVNIALNIILVRRMGIGGIALATSIAAGVSLLLSVLLLKKKFPNLRLVESYVKIAGIVLFAAISVGVGRIIYSSLLKVIWMPRMCYLGIAIATTAIIYYLILNMANVREMQMVKQIFNRK